MTFLNWIFDGVLGLTLLWLGWRTVFASELLDTILSFIALGMLIALSWLRLGAPDVALAEAALGGGVTGALLLAAYNRLERSNSEDKEQDNKHERFHPVVSVAALLIVSAIGGMLAWTLWSLPARAFGLSLLVREKLPESGVSAEVTAVLLNFRGYDTLLELAVLLAALLGTWHLGLIQVPREKQEPGAVLETLVRYLVPLMVLTSGYVLWLGGHASGGAFQAGALLAGAGVLLFVVWPQALGLRENKRLRALIVAGPALFALVAGGVMFNGSRLLEYPPQFAGALILLIEAASTLSIGIILLLLFAGGRPDSGEEK